MLFELILKLPDKRERVVNAIASVAQDQRHVKISAIAGPLLSMSPKQLRRVLQEQAVIEGLRLKGIQFELPKGRIVFTKVPSAPQGIGYEAEREVEEVSS